MTQWTHLTRAAMAAAVAAAIPGCDMIQVKGKVTTTKIKDGKVETKEREFHSWAEMGEALSAAYDDMADTTRELVEKLTEAPPPGKVTLTEMFPDLAKYEGDPDVDFLSQAKSGDGKPLDFTYVQIGVPQYDQFFKTSMEVYALAYQTNQVTHRLREVAAYVLNEKPDADVGLFALVSRAQKADSSDPAAKKQLDQLAAVAQTLGRNAAALVQKIQQLVAAGQGLIAGAAASITNPKTVIHLKLIKKGLVQSIKVIKETAPLLGDLAGQLADFS